MFGYSKKNKTSKSKPKTKLTPKTKAKTTPNPKSKLPTSKPKSIPTIKPKVNPTSKPTSKLAISKLNVILTTKPKAKITTKLIQESSTLIKEPKISKPKALIKTDEIDHSTTQKSKRKNIGKVFWGKSKFIDNDLKPRRRYVVVRESNEEVKVAKLSGYKENNENFVEIKNTYPGLTKRTGIFKLLFSKNKKTKKPLTVAKGNNVFDDKEIFTLDDADIKKVEKFIKTKSRKS